MRVLRMVEKLLVRVTLLGLALLVAVQLVLTGSTTSMLDFRVKQPPFEDSQGVIGQNLGEASKVTFTLTDYSALGHARVYVNGKQRASFADKSVTLKVYPGDLLEIDTSFYKNPVKIKVSASDGKVIKAKAGTVLTLHSERKALIGALR